MSAVEPRQEGEEVTDTTGKKWKLVKLLSCSPTELIYEGETQCMTSGQILKGKINVQSNRQLFWDSQLDDSDDNHSAITFTVTTNHK